MLLHKRDRSREAKCPPRFAFSPLQERGKRSADRRTGASAPVRSGPVTQVRASPRREAFTVCAPGDARLSALHRGGLLASGPARDESFAMLPSLSNHWACELLASARSAEGGSPVASRASVCMHRLAGRRIPSCFSNASRKHPRRTGRQDDSPWRCRVKSFRALCTKCRA